MKKRWLACVVALALVLGMVPGVTASAAEDLGSDPVQLDICDGSISIVSGTDTVTYTQGDSVYTSTGGCIVTQSDTSVPTENRIDIKADSEDCLKVKLTIASLNIESKTSPIALYGEANVTLTLVGESTLICIGTEEYGINQAGLRVSQLAMLTIKGNGFLSVAGSGHSAGIGGSFMANAGTIIIDSGTIYATGGMSSAGIGGALGNKETMITINGGTINATGGWLGAGIGRGFSGDGGTIIISGGTINATGGHMDGAGIGGGNGGKGGIIVISNAMVIAEGDYHAIGGGELDNQYGCDSITVGENAVLELNVREEGSLFSERIEVYSCFDSASHSGNSALFCADAFGHSGITYQWQMMDGEEWLDVEGQTSATASIPVTEDNAGSTYRCAITNVYGNTVYTDEVKSYILAFTQQPESVETDLDDIVALSVTSSCSNVTYQWQRSYDGEMWTNVAGKTSPTLVVTTTFAENGTLYRCVITATNGDTLASDPARITVNTDAVTYSTDFYLEQADGSYAIAERVTLESRRALPSPPRKKSSTTTRRTPPRASTAAPSRRITVWCSPAIMNGGNTP